MIAKHLLVQLHVSFTRLINKLSTIYNFKDTVTSLRTCYLVIIGVTLMVGNYVYIYRLKISRIKISHSVLFCINPYYRHVRVEWIINKVLEKKHENL